MSINRTSIGRASPLVALVLLATMLVTGGIDVYAPANADRYFTLVAERIRQIPYQIGAWNGIDEPMTEPARELLKPNELLQRRYHNRDTGESFTLLLIHCKNTRDMEGHYPPVCYPRHGWSMGRTDHVVLSVDGQQIPANRYSFEKPSRQTAGMNVLGFFVLPSNEQPYTAGMEALTRASRARSAAGMGAAQIQIITERSMAQSRRDEIVAMVLEEIGPTLRLIARGTADE